MKFAVFVGGGGSSGSVTLENLMEKISFGHKPKIVDLTSKRRLADKVRRTNQEQFPWTFCRLLAMLSGES